MGNLIEVGKTGELNDGAMKKLAVQGQEILLARAGGQFYAADNVCPHMNGDLAAGSLEGTVVTCPRHQSQFDLKDGKVVRWMKGPGMLAAMSKVLKPPRPLKTYPVKTEGGRIFIEV